MKKLKQESDEEVPLNLDLPLDIIADILSRLDVKTLTLLKCVSRSCRDFISDPSFVDTHRQQSMKNVKFLCASPDSVAPPKTLSFYSMSNQHSYRWEKLSSCTSEKLSNFSFIYDARVCPVTCDLVCLCRRDDIYLCNPSTGEVCVLPEPSTRLTYSYLGFGYSSQVREYKVVNMFRPHVAPVKRSKIEGDTRTRGMGCEVFTLSNDSKIASSSSWKRLTCPRGVHSETTSANGRIYWLINHRTPLRSLKTEELILSFDIANDTFSTLSRPPSWPLGSYKDKVAFMAMDGMLCITNKRNMQKNGVLDIWRLEENHLWAKIYSINLLESIKSCRALHPECMAGGEIILVVRHSTAFFYSRNSRRYSYNIESKTLRELRISDGWHTLGVFWESFFKLQ